MGTSDHPQVGANTARTTTALWLAMLIGVGSYAGVAAYLTTAGPFAPGTVGLPRVLLWISVGYLAAVVAAAPVVEGAVRRQATSTTPPDLARAWQTEKVVGLAVRESGGLLGITVSLLMGSGRWAILFGAATVVSMFLAKPRSEELAARLADSI